MFRWSRSSRSCRSSAEVAEALSIHAGAGRLDPRRGDHVRARRVRRRAGAGEPRRPRRRPTGVRCAGRGGSLDTRRLSRSRRCRRGAAPDRQTTPVPRRGMPANRRPSRGRIPVTRTARQSAGRSEERDGCDRGGRPHGVTVSLITYRSRHDEAEFGLTRCSRNGECFHRGPAPPPRCSPATCCCCRTAGAPRSPGSWCRDDVEFELRGAAAVSSPAGASSWPTRSTRSGSTCAVRRRSTSAPRRAASPTVCSSGAPPTSSRVDVAYGELDWRLRSDPRVTVIERTNARALAGRCAALPARPDRDRRLVHLAAQGAAGRARLRGRALRLPGDGQAAVRGRPRARRQGRRRARRRRAPARAGGRRARGARELGAAVLGFASSGLPGPKGNLETFVWLARGAGGRGALDGGRARRRGRREVEP